MLNGLQIEAAARKLCEIRGLDADYAREINLYPSNKELAEREIRAHLQVQEAVTYACEVSRFHPLAEQMPCDCAPLTNCSKCGGSGTIQGRVEPL